MFASAPRLAKCVNIFFHERFPIYGIVDLIEIVCNNIAIATCCILHTTRYIKIKVAIATHSNMKVCNNTP